MSNKPTDKDGVQRDSLRVDGIRLGPDRKRSLALDAVGAEPEAKLVATFDWHGLCARFSLTRLEERALIQHLRHEVAVYQLHVVLECSRREAKQALAAALEKIGRSSDAIGFAPIMNSRRLAFRERFPNGQRPWALSPIPEEFLAIMADERNYFTQGLLPDTVAHPKKYADLGLVSMDLKEKLQSERQKLTRISELLHRNRVAKEEGDAALGAATDELRQARASAILEGRQVNHAPLESKLADLQRKARECQVGLQSAVDAHAQQLAVCEQLEGEITTRAKEFFLAESGAVMARIRVKVPALADDMLELQGIAARHGQDPYALAVALFPPGPECYRGGALQVVNAALGLNAHRGQWPTKKSA